MGVTACPVVSVAVSFNPVSEEFLPFPRSSSRYKMVSSIIPVADSAAVEAGVQLCSPGCPGTHSGLKLVLILLSSSPLCWDFGNEPLSCLRAVNGLVTAFTSQIRSVYRGSL